MRIESQISNSVISTNSQVQNARGASRANSDFGARLESTQKTAAKQDSISLTGSSYEQRLENLKKLHAQTDYSGMSDWDKSRLIQSRFDEAFPNIHAMYGGLFNSAGNNTIYTKIMDELDSQKQNINDIPQTGSGFDPERAKYVFGYGGLSDSEIRSMVNEKYNGGTLEDKCGALQELMSMELDEGAGPYMLNQIQREMVQGTEAKYGNLFRDNPLRVNAMISYATNTTMNWTQLARSTMQYYTNSTYGSEDAKSEFLANLGSNLDKFLDNMIHADKER